MKYSVEQRHEIYKKTLEVIEFGEWKGICLAIDAATKESNYNYERHFPEFWLFYPPEPIHGHWWDLHDKDSRINCLLFCIEMTKGKSSKNLSKSIKK